MVNIPARNYAQKLTNSLFPNLRKNLSNIPTSPRITPTTPTTPTFAPTTPASEADQLYRAEIARGGRGGTGGEVVDIPPATEGSNVFPYQNTWQQPADTIWRGGNKMGERDMYLGAISPLAHMTDILLDRLNPLIAQPQTLQGQMDGMQGMAPMLQSLMGITPEQQTQYLQGYRDIQQPFRSQQQAGMGNTMAAMGMGGGRLARALTQMQGGYANEDAQVAQQLLGRNMDTNNQIGQMLFGGAQTQLGNNNQMMQAILSMLGQNAQQSAALPMQIEQTFRPQDSV